MSGDFQSFVWLKCWLVQSDQESTGMIWRKRLRKRVFWSVRKYRTVENLSTR